MTVSDTSRGIHHEPDHSYPHSVVIRVRWVVDGHVSERVEQIDADRFFGLGNYGAPIEGAALVSIIENMRRAGPPPVNQKGKKNGVRKARR
jgi:hypothetical protein